MHDRDIQQARESQKAMDAYISERVKEVGPAAHASPVDELAKLADLHKSGVISDEEFAAMKAKILA
jgi:Short C-terminal domain